MDHLNKRVNAANPPGNVVSWHALHGRLSRLNRLFEPHPPLEERIQALKEL